MAAESGDHDKDELTSEWGGESRQDWWGWRNHSGSWLQDEVTQTCTKYLNVNERCVIVNE